MEIRLFNNLVDTPLELSFQDKVLVQEECGKSPYSAILRLFDLLCSKACNIAVGRMSDINATLLYLPEKNTLNTLLEKVRLKDNDDIRKTEEKPEAETPVQTVVPEQTPEPEPAAKHEPMPEPQGDILKEINDYQEISFKTAPKSVILDQFLETTGYRNSDSVPIEPVAVSESGKKSIQPNTSLHTETLALILEKQGKYEKAIAVYENLSALNPEKNATFAARIEELKHKCMQQ